MSQLRRLQEWIESNKDITLDLIRIYLGIGLLAKGLQFINDEAFLLDVMRRSDTLEFKFNFVRTFLAHYIPLAHLGGGVLLALGFMTRITVLFQLPVLMGAVWFSRSVGRGVLSHNQEFQFSALVLFLLLMILFHGVGRLSVDYHLERR